MTSYYNVKYSFETIGLCFVQRHGKILGVVSEDRCIFTEKIRKDKTRAKTVCIRAIKAISEKSK